MLRLLLQTLTYHWRGNGAVLLGVLVGSTVLTGALLVGDSLKGSLRDRAIRQLRWVDQALVAPRFIRAGLADEIRSTTGTAVSGVILLRTTVAIPGTGLERRQVRGVTVLGIDDRFLADENRPEGSFVWLNDELARELRADVGTAIEVRLVKPSALPRETVLARKDLGVLDWRIQVTRVLQGNDVGNHFNLRPGVEAPRNLIVPLSLLQEQLGVPDQINTILAEGSRDAVSSALTRHLRLEDHGLTIFTPELRARALLKRYDRNRDGVLRGAEWFRRVDGKRKPLFADIIAKGIKQANPDVLTLSEITDYYHREHPYLTLESQQLLLPPVVARVAFEAAVAGGMRGAGTTVYLCRMQADKERIAGVVAALEPSQAAPLGPFLPAGKKELGENEIVLVSEAWPAENRPAVGSSVVLTFKPPESHGPAPDLKQTFRVAGTIALAGVAADPSLTPEFPGITDKDDTSEWTLPFDDPNWQQQTMREEYTDRYWDNYRATPKAYIRLADGVKLWSSRFGALTSIRLAGARGDSLDKSAERFRALFLDKLKPEESGFVFDDVKARALEASKGGVAFDQLFLGFSSFLIVSALLLVGLLYRLNLDRRASQVGLLFAEGYSRRNVGGLLLGEGSILAITGVMLGVVAALAYSGLLVKLLAALWPGGILQSFLSPHWTAKSLAIGAGGALLVSVMTIGWVVFSLGRVPPRALLAGQTTGESELGTRRSVSWWLLAIVLVCILAGMGLLIVGPFMQGQEAKAGTFFGSGALFLTAGLVAVYAWMKGTRHRAVEGHGWWNIAWLGVRNAARHPARSMLTVGLLASAAFLIVAVESFRRKAVAGDGSITAPDGGFALVAESDLPIVRDLQTRPGRRELLEQLQRKLVATLAPAEAEQQVQQAEKLLQETTIIAFRARAGDDASCLNLFQPRTPRLLGVPRSLIDRGGFVFDATRSTTAEEKANPWLILTRSTGEVPAFGEANTVTWMLKSALGKTLKVPDDRGETTPLVLSGLLHDSVFQSSLLIAEEQFLKLYPGHEGYQYFFIAPPSGREDEVKRLLELALDDRGFAATRSADRLAAFLAIENTYLTTFQALGGLGLILGSLGLAVVLLRAVWERRAELALMRALGWRRLALGWLVLAENCFLLVVGLAVGALSALLSITPQLVSGAGAVPLRELALLLAVVMGVGLVAGSAAVMGTLRAPIVPALRRE